MGLGGELEDSTATDYDAAAEEGDLYVQKQPASAEQVGCTPLAGLGGTNRDGHCPQAPLEMHCLQHPPFGHQGGSGQHGWNSSQSGSACIWLISLERLDKGEQV